FTPFTSQRRPVPGLRRERLSLHRAHAAEHLFRITQLWIFDDLLGHLVEVGRERETTSHHLRHESRPTYFAGCVACGKQEPGDRLLKQLPVTRHVWLGI